MRRYTFITIVCLLLTVQTQAQHLFEHDYPVVTEENPLVRELMNRVSQDSLYATIDHLQSYHTRHWKSQTVFHVENWLYNSYSSFGLDSVYLHVFPMMFHDTLYETSDNVIAIQRGVLYPDEYVVCGAHYDSYNNDPGDPDSLRAPGADDNASGVAGIKEIARLLSPYKFERSIVYCNFAAEEAGLVGSAAYAHDCAEQQMDIVGYFNLDMIGYLEEGLTLQMTLIYVDRDSTLANYTFDFSHVYYPELLVRRSFLYGGDSDFSSFNRNRYAAIHLFENTRHHSPFIHTTSDILGVSVNNMEQATLFTEMTLGLVATLAGPTSTSVNETDILNLTVYPNPASDMITVKGALIRQVEVYNIMGQRMLLRSYPDVEECQVQIGSLVPGIYFVQVLNKEGRLFTEKIVKNDEAIH